MKRTLVLFDIDGTLVLTGRAGLRGMDAAFAALHGWTSALDGIDFAGRTDRAIVADVFRGRGLDAPSEAELFAVRDAYVEALGREIAKPSPWPSGVLPGVLDVLGVAEQDPAVVVGLLTGNFERGAEVKLGHFDLWRRFEFGAFGDHHVNRRDLVPVALDRARERGHQMRAEDVVIIGDTPLDVDCAHAHGARAIGVATGPFSVDALRAVGADLVVETLEQLRGAKFDVRSSDVDS